MANISEKELIERYQNYAELVRKKWHCDSEKFIADAKSIEKFCIGLGKSEVIREEIPDATRGKNMCQHNGLIWLLNCNENYRNQRGQDDNLVILSTNSITITNYDKTLTFWNPMFISREPIPEEFNSAPESLIDHAFFMTEVTPDGFFEFFLDQNNHDWYRFRFYRNADILDCGYLTSSAEGIEDIKYDIAHGHVIEHEFLDKGLDERYYLNRNVSLSPPHISIDSKDFALLANKIYRKGLPYVAELARTGGVLEITDEDRKHFEEISRVTQKNATPAEAPKDSTSMEYPENDNFQDIEKAIQSLKNLSSMGIELTEDQKDLLELYNKLTTKLNSQKFILYYDMLNSQKFEQYKGDAKAREERQATVREKIAKSESERIKWQSSPEYPSNIRAQQLQEMQSQVDALNNVGKFIPLSELQENTKKELQTFFDMKDKADAEEHRFDSNMSEEIREWYQNEYGAQETSTKKAK